MIFVFLHVPQIDLLNIKIYNNENNEIFSNSIEYVVGFIYKCADIVIHFLGTAMSVIFDLVFL